MYGIMYNALSEMIVKGFGEDKWKQVMKEADIELGGGSFLIHRHYKDDIMTRLLNSAAKILALPYDELVERYGEHFFKYCLECGYERLLRVLGRNLYDFLCNLDALHDHLTSIYPGMKAPSFRCYLADDGTMTLRYYSDRKGLERMVAGIIKAVAREFFETKVSVTLTSRKGRRQDHTVFHVREDNFTTILVRKRSSSLVSVLHRAKSSTNPKDLPLSVMSFCKAFPFHLIIDRHFQIVQAGSALCRVLRTYRKKHPKKLMFDKVFQVVRPVLNTFNFETLLDHINTVFIVVSKPGVIDRPKTSAFYSGGSSGNSSSSSSKTTVTAGTSGHSCTSGGTGSGSTEQALRLKGQMVFIPETDTVLYLCSPRVTDVDELRERGLYLSDIPIHDATRDLILITQARRAERELVETLEETSNNLKKLQSKLREDKGRTDELLNSLLPSGIAERLRLNQSVEAEKYNLVTILFSDIVGFTAMCGNEHVVPMDIVRLLNRLYTHFDVLSNIHDVYKVETIGDAYMVVGGMPEFTESHADRVTSMAFAMMEVSQTVFSPVMDCPIQIRIGIHSGPCVAGVVGQKMPRYCLFGHTVAVASKMENSSQPGKVNISHVARGYLSSMSVYEFEENRTREDLPTECSFIKLKQNAPRPVAMDLGVPLPRGMFRTPNPSPTNSRGASPVEGASPSASPLKLNSPEGTVPKFKTPAIHICDADEEDFRASLQAKMNQVAVGMATGTSSSESAGPGEPPPEPPSVTSSTPAVTSSSEGNTASTMSFKEYLFGDDYNGGGSSETTTLVAKATTKTTMTPSASPPAEVTSSAVATASPSPTSPINLFEAKAELEAALRRHSHQPTSGASPGGETLVVGSGQPLAKSVTLSDMTDPSDTRVLVVSLESPSSVSSSVSEADDLSAASGGATRTSASASGSPPLPPPPPSTSSSSTKFVTGVSRWCVPCTSSSSSTPSTSPSQGEQPYTTSTTVNVNNNVHPPTSPKNMAETGSAPPHHCISRRRSEPAKHIDLSKIVDLRSPARPDATRGRSETALPVSPPSSAGTHSVTPSTSPRTPRSGLDQGAGRATNGAVRRVGGGAPDGGSSGRRKGAGGNESKSKNAEGVGNPFPNSEASNEHPSPNPTPHVSSSSHRQGRTSTRDRLTVTNDSQSHHKGAPQRPPTERLSKADLKRIKENGRLVIYFKGRPRSMSPSLRLHPLTFPEGSRSLHDSPFSSPMLTQKLHSLQGELSSKGGQDAFFRHVRLKRRDLNVSMNSSGKDKL